MRSSCVGHHAHCLQGQGKSWQTHVWLLQALYILMPPVMLQIGRLADRATCSFRYCVQSICGHAWCSTPADRARDARAA